MVARSSPQPRMVGLNGYRATLFRRTHASAVPLKPVDAELGFEQYQPHCTLKLTCKQMLIYIHNTKQNDGTYLQLTKFSLCQF